MNFKGIAAGVCAAAVAVTLAGCAAPTAESAKTDGNKACVEKMLKKNHSVQGLELKKQLKHTGKKTMDEDGKYGYSWEFVTGMQTAEGKRIYSWECTSYTTKSGTTAKVTMKSKDIIDLMYDPHFKTYLNWGK